MAVHWNVVYSCQVVNNLFNSAYINNDIGKIFFNRNRLKDMNKEFQHFEKKNIIEKELTFNNLFENDCIIIDI